MENEKRNNILRSIFHYFIYILALALFTVTSIHQLEVHSSSTDLTAEELAIEGIWQDIVYFPIPMSADEGVPFITYTDTWGAERTYGGERLHEGTDLMATVDEPGLYPVLSISDGVVTNKGWLEKGGYRIGITSEHGGYFYYAHLDSYADVNLGDTVKAGQLLGYMGDSGYGEEGTTGMFASHLHLGIYITLDGVETAINPYPFLIELEKNILVLEY